MNPSFGMHPLPGRCLFCTSDSTRSVSVEHVAPESLGNTEIILPPGLVCDACNNYFARKVEAPFLNSAPIRALRHTQALVSKRGRIPALEVLMDDGTFGILSYDNDERRHYLALDDSTLERGITQQQVGGAMWHVAPESAKPDRMAARFVGKVGIEYLMFLNLSHPLGPTALLDAPETQACRRFVRYGEGPMEWDIQVRRIYEPEHLFADDLTEGQKVWEMDFLVLDDRWIIFAMSIFGLEFAINLTGPDLSPYVSWSEQHHKASLLYPDGIPSSLGTRHERR